MASYQQQNAPTVEECQQKYRKTAQLQQKPQRICIAQTKSSAEHSESHDAEEKSKNKNKIKSK